ncbi:uncharacterized protein ASPGLDRAFT_43974 [Aspergillus glaucus CBS 516.65]|uniref:Uncharacterized protein n=1 Tax=Aspergillus glaucus CBS 516.65 TaxID=1160497 RepID=A0A1L9VU55_ASPGL|nr:hypothetical protein ASPGLDRAFT_43974 [Aspergillus glaucus CBS 516.65]OJJ87417.1 hypothetical protein ASPGLDRAFT_43974 [Aspergillus glaucus CBS 516.65]
MGSKVPPTNTPLSANPSPRCATRTAPSSTNMDSSSRRSLPPPPSRTLPPPQLTAAHTPPQLPPPPPSSQWHSADKDPSMHLWLRARAEEDRRKQEEEKARQETLRLEQRVVEHSMLRDALQAGVPPHMVPLIFAGISGGGLPQAAIDLAQQYVSHPVAQGQGQGPGPGPVVASMPPPPAPPAPPPPQHHQHQPQHQQHHPHHHYHQSSGPDMPPSTFPPPPPPFSHRHSHSGSIDLRRHSHSVPPNTLYNPQPPVPSPGEILPSQPPTISRGSSPVRQPLGQSPFPPSGPPSSSSLPQPPIPPGNSTQQYAQAPPASTPQSIANKEYQYRPRQSTSIYFHHWVPPGQQPPSGKSQEYTPGGKAPQESSGGKPSDREEPIPASSRAHSRSVSEDHSSPSRKRKAQGLHQPAPIPSSRSRQSSIVRDSVQ